MLTKIKQRARSAGARAASVPSSPTLPKGSEKRGKEKGSRCVWRQAIVDFNAGLINKSEMHRRLRAEWGEEVFEQTYSSWENMKARCKRGYAELDEQLNYFPDFALHLGPRPPGHFSLERSNNLEGYSPENCLWADKVTQSNNRRNTVYLTDKDDLRLPLTEWARRLAIPAATLHRRRKQGWTDEEILGGIRESSEGDGLSVWPKDNALAWETQFKRVGGRSQEDRWSYLKVTCDRKLGRLKAELKFIFGDADEPPAADEQRVRDIDDEWDYYSGHYSRAHAALQRIAVERHHNRKEILFPHRYRSD